MFRQVSSVAGNVAGRSSASDIITGPTITRARCSCITHSSLWFQDAHTFRYDGTKSSYMHLFDYLNTALSCVVYGSVVVTTYDFESGCPGSNPEWGSICYKASIIAQGSPEPSSLRGSTSVPGQLSIKAVCKLIDGCNIALCSAKVSVVSSGMCHINRINSIAWLYQWAQPKI